MKKRRAESSLVIVLFPLIIVLGGCTVGSNRSSPPPPNPSPNPDFSIAVSPGTASAAPGGTSNAVMVSVTGTNGFTGQTVVSITGLPQGATVTPVQPFNVVVGSQQAMSITVPTSTAPGNMALTVTGTSGLISHSAPLALAVMAVSRNVVRPPAPAMPAAVDPAVVAMPDTTGYAVVVVADTGNAATNGDDLRTAANNASCNPNGTVIRLVPGVNYDVSSSIMLPAKNCAPGQWILIRSDAADASLPPEGTRIDPSFAGMLPKVRATSLNVRPFRVGGGAMRYRFLGLEITTTVLGPANSASGIELGDGGAGQNTLAAVPRQLVVDRCYIHGGSALPARALRRGVEMHCGDCAVVESYISEIHEVGFDSQAIGGWNGPGPMLIRNNYLEAAGENILIGGASTSIQNMNPSDITIERNHLFKPYTWRVGHASYLGTRWTIKNLLELKTGVRVLIEGNVLENCWADAQVCAAFNIKSSNSGGNLWAQTADVTVRYNHILRAEGGALQLQGWNGIFQSQFLERVHVHDNLFEDQGAGTFGGADGGNYTVFSNQTRSIRFEHNTLINAGPNAGQSYVFDSDVTSPNLPFPNGIAIHDNVMGTSSNPNAQRTAKESCSVNGGAPQPWACFDNPISTPNGEDSWHRNLVYHASPNSNFCTPTRPLSTGSPWALNRAACVGTLTDVGFVHLSGRNFRLAPSSLGKGAATDGRDVGADIDLVETKTAGVR